jgi:hypothetical protein
VTLAALAAGVYCSVLAYVIAHASTVAVGTGALGGLGALCLAWALVRANAYLVPWPLALLGTAYAVALVVRGSGVDDAAPLVAVGLLLCGELAAWSIDERLAVRAERAVFVARGAALAALAFGSLLVATLAVALATAPAGAGLAWTILGAASTVAVVGVAVALARRA